MRELVFTGGTLTQEINLVTDGFDSDIQNVTVQEIKRGQNVLSQLPATSNASEIALLAEFLRLPYAKVNLKQFALDNALTLTMRDQDASEQLVGNVLTSLDVNTITFVSGNVVRYAFNGSPDLSGVSEGFFLRVISATNAVNNGTFRILAIDDTNDTLDIVNPDRSSATGNEATNSPAVGTVVRF